MRERPILFSGPMVRAILAGQKTQTRRAAKKSVRHPDLGNLYTPGALVLEHEPQHVIERACPYGQPGDRLWVRESFDFLPAGGHDEPQACEIVYWADGSIESRSAPPDYNPTIYSYPKIRPSIHMPRWALRITLEIISVRVQRLRDISEADARAEGAPWAACGSPQEGSHKAGFARLWESINGAGSWAANPWVWAVEFRRITP